MGKKGISEAWEDLGDRKVDPIVHTRVNKLSQIEGLIGREALLRSFEIFSQPILMGDAEEATRQMRSALDELKSMNYPVGGYESLDPAALYFHYSSLRTESNVIRPLAR